MAFLNEFSTKSRRRRLMRRRSGSIGTHWTSATPRVATSRARVAAAAKAPSSELRQFMVTPTTRTIVKASTNSTAEARNAAEATAHCNCIQDSPFLSWGIEGILRQKGNPHKQLHADSLVGCIIAYECYVCVKKRGRKV